MHLFYIDESGNTGSNLDSADQPIHWLMALGVSPAAVKALEAEMLSLALRYFPDRAREPDFEFHGSHIYTRRGDCRGWPAERAVELYRELLRLVARFDCHLFISGIDKAKLKRRAAARVGYTPHHPYRVALMYLVERVDEWLAQRQARGSGPAYGLLVADEQKEVDRQAVERFAFWRQQGTEYGGGRAIRHLIDTVHYVPSHDSWMIQLADCVLYLFSRYHRVTLEKGDDVARYTAAEDAVVRLWRENCANKVARHYLWPT
jgi:hypothetical protein